MRTISLALLARLATLLAPRVSAVMRYVDAASTSPNPPDTSWQTAAQLIIAAVNVSADGDTILVTNGKYFGQFRHIPLTNSITPLSVNARHVTSDDGGGLCVGEAEMVQGCVISYCQASQSSGGIYNYFGTVENAIVWRILAVNVIGV